MEYALGRLLSTAVAARFFPSAAVSSAITSVASISSSSLGSLVSSFWMLRRPASLLGGVLRLSRWPRRGRFPVRQLCGARALLQYAATVVEVGKFQAASFSGGRA